jgi:spore coat protein A, manganese oxidase
VQSRRTFLKTAALSAAAAAHLRASSALLNPLSQPKFVNPLRIPGVLDLQSGGFASIAATQFSQWLGLRDGSGSPLPTTVWGYGGSYPGPTILARKNTPVNIEWKNELRSGGTPLPHLLPIDTSIHWADPQHSHGAGYSGPVPIVTHLHGGHTASSSDGHPDAWFTPGAAYTGRLYQQVYQYDHSQDAATLWYHDHAIGITRLNVYAGLAGFYLLRDQEELDAIAANALPSGPYEIGLAIQDRMFTENGQLFYPSEPEEYGQPSPSVLPEFFGDFILVNGVTWPVLDVEPRLYRFRLLNGSDSRFYRLFLSSGQAFLQIGGDSGFLPAPVWMNQLTLGPGERADVILDFRGRTGQSIVMRNVARSPFPKGDVADPRTTGQIMMFRVSVPLGSTPIATLNGIGRPVTPLTATANPRRLLLFEGMDSYGRLKPALGTLSGAFDFTDPATEMPALNSVEVWDIFNTTEDAHPIHVHLVQYQVLSRQGFRATQNSATGALSNIQLLGQPKPPEPNESGWKDTAIMYPGEVTRIIAKFDRPGEYVWHCHILSHEDHEMMRPLVVGS